MSLLRSVKPNKLGTAKQLHYVQQRHEKEVRRSRSATPVGARLRIWRQDPHCQMCKKFVDYPRGFELDHIKPIWAGGDNSDENLQILCPPCHEKKTLEEGSKGAKIETKIKKITTTLRSAKW